MFLGTHHSHTLLYPNCTWTILGTVFTNHSSAMDKSWIVSWWFFKTSSTTFTVFTCCWSASLKGVIFMMDANPLLNSLHPLPKWCGHSTQSPNTTINWHWISRVEMFSLYKLSHHKVFCMTKFPLSLPLHKTYPLNSTINWLLHHLPHVTSLAVSTAHYKIKGLLNKITELGTLRTEQASCIDCCWVTMLRNIMTPFSVGLWR